MLLAVPISQTQLWVFLALSLLFFASLFRAFSRRTAETGGKRDNRSRLGIVLQSVGMAFAGFGAARPTLAPLLM